MAAFHHLIGCAGGHHFDGLAGADRAFHNAEIHHNAPVAVVLAVEYQRFQRRFGIPLGGGDILHDVLQHGFNVDAHFGGDLRGVHGGQADNVLHLLLGLLGIGGREVDLVEHRQDLQIVLHGKVGIGQRLRLHALRGVHHQHSALAGSQRAGNLIVEVHMARRVNQIQLIDLSILRLVVQLHSAGLDGDAPFPLQIHVVQQLVFHLALGDRPALFQQPVRQGGLAVVNVGDDGKIADIALFRHTDKTSVGRSTRIPHGANFNWIAAYDAAVWN